MSHAIAKTSRFFGAAAASLLIAGLAHAGIRITAGDTAIEATSLTFSVSQQPVYDPETYVPVEPKRSQLYTGSFFVSRGFDATSVKVVKHVVDGTKLPEVEIVMTRDGVPGRQVWTLTNAAFNNYSTYTGEGSEVIENFDISYENATLSVYSDAGNTPVDTISWAAAQ